MFLFLTKSCVVDVDNYIIYYWSKDEGYPLENIEIFSDTLKSVNQSIEYYTNKAITSNVLEKFIEKDHFTLENKFLCISVFNHTPVMLAITSLSKILSPKYLRFSL
jgi:hypothetical protein